MYNIWYNKYSDKYQHEPHHIEPKTDKKIKELKAKMVQKLIFQQLIDYAQIKASNIITIDKWFKPIDNYSNNHTNIIATNSTDNNNQLLPINSKVQPKHEIKINL